MLAYLPLVQRFLLDYVSRKASGQGFSFNFRGVAFLAASGVLAFLTLIFLLFALQTYTADIYGVPMSWLLTAGTTALLGLILYIAGTVSKKKKGLVEKVKAEMEGHLSPLASIVEDLSAPVKDHPVAAVVLAALAGLLAGDKLGDKLND